MVFFQQELPKKSGRDQKTEGYKDHDRTKLPDRKSHRLSGSPESLKMHFNTSNRN
jgi:hypothetical protein